MSFFSSLLLIESRGKNPDFIAKTLVKTGKWREVGVAFYNPKSESVTVFLDVIPVTGKIVLFKPRKATD